MDGTTLRISSADFSQAINLSSGGVLLVRHDGAPHRYCVSMDAAKKAAQWVDDPVPWAVNNPGKSDDGWDNAVSFRGDNLATIKERSRVLYDEPEAAAAPTEKSTAGAHD